MLVTEIQLRKIIREAIEADTVDKMTDKLDDAIDGTAEDGLKSLEAALAKMKNIEKQAIANPEKFKEKIKDIKESYMLQEQKLNEAVGWVLAGIAAAAPVIMQGVGLAVEKIAPVIMTKIDTYEGSEEHWEQKAKEYGAWWKNKSKDLHHLYIGTIESLVKTGYSIATLGRKKLDDKKAHKIAAGIWTLIVAFLMYKSGIGVMTIPLFLCLFFLQSIFFYDCFCSTGLLSLRIFRKI